MKTDILKLLRNNESYLSGQELCRQFHVSRTAVWKIMNQLKEEGYEIEAVQNKGYRLKSIPDLLSKSELESRINTKWAGSNVFFFQKTTSTNAEAQRCMDEGAPHGTLVVAEEQTAGRGRRGRGWESPAESSVYMSIGLRPDFEPAKVSMLTLVMALSVAEAVEEVTGLDTKIKWPNDLVVNRKKICGILTEMTMEMEYIKNVVIGVGINVNIKKIPAEIMDTGTSLFLEKGESVSRAVLIERCMEYFEKNYEIFLKTLDLSCLKEKYEAKLVNQNQVVRILDPKGEYEGTARGIETTGELLIEMADGSLEQVYAGEVSVRGYYGYV